jgi:hypothetical protein
MANHGKDKVCGVPERAARAILPFHACTQQTPAREFPQLVASGVTGAEAYRSVTGNGAGAKNAHVHSD